MEIRNIGIVDGGSSFSYHFNLKREICFLGLLPFALQLFLFAES